MSASAIFSYDFTNNLLWIKDIGEQTTTVTDDIVNVLNDIISESGKTLSNYKIVYRDESKNWISVNASYDKNGLVTEVSFFDFCYSTLMSS